MSEPLPRKQKNAHGTMLSYVIGFILSLIFTVNAYIAVVSKSASSTTLLAMILGFAILQMLVQIFFFLHLGRGPKPLYNVVFFASTVGLIMVVVLGSIFIMDNLHYNMVPTDVAKKLTQDEGISQVEGQNTGACQEVFANHEVTISDGKVNPATTTARRCDTLTFISTDDTAHDIFFGPYPQRGSYAGESNLSIHKGYTKTITLNQVGAFSFHDDTNQDIRGDFNVTQ